MKKSTEKIRKLLQTTFKKSWNDFFIPDMVKNYVLRELKFV